MIFQKEKNAAKWMLIPVVGTGIFFLLYITATFLYPGGSQADAKAAGFSWVNNYWCNLLAENAINGKVNSARPVAMMGMFVLCVSLSSFWWLLPGYIGTKKRNTIIIKVCGVGAMTTAIFLFTGVHHDLIVNLAASFGVAASILTLFILYRKRWQALFIFGLLNIGLVILNNYLYYAEGMMVYLPVVQKISFASFLLWICTISVRLYRNRRLSEYPTTG